MKEEMFDALQAIDEAGILGRMLDYLPVEPEGGRHARLDEQGNLMLDTVSDGPTVREVLITQFRLPFKRFEFALFRNENNDLIKGRLAVIGGESPHDFAITGVIGHSVSDVCNFMFGPGNVPDNVEENGGVDVRAFLFLAQRKTDA